MQRIQTIRSSYAGMCCAELLESLREKLEINQPPGHDVGLMVKESVEEFVRLGLSDHPVFLNWLELCTLLPPSHIALKRAKNQTDKLLEDAKNSVKQGNVAVIDGRRCGVKACIETQAIVYVEISGKLHLVNIDRLAKKTIWPNNGYHTQSYNFVSKHFNSFENLCKRVCQPN